MRRGRFEVTNEAVLWGGVVALAGLLRLVSLGWPPLSDPEAMAALSAAKGAMASPFWSGGAGPWASVSYQTLTGWLFQVLGTSDSVARWAPALAGIGLLALPWLLRRRLGSARAIILAVLLAISPAMLTTARTAGGTSLALLGVGTLLGAALGNGDDDANRRRYAWMGVGLGLALASGPSGWSGLLSLGIAAAWVRWRSADSEDGLGMAPGATRVLALALLVTVLGLAVQFGAGMDGLGVALQAPALWLAGWTQPGVLPLLTAVVLLPAYEPLIFIFGLVGAGRTADDDLIWRGARAWALVAVLMVVLRPGRTADDLVWVVLPLALLATLPLSSLSEVLSDGLEDLSVYLMAAVLAALAGFTYLQLAGYINAADVGGSPEMLTLGLVLTAIGFAASLFLLYGMTWSWAEAFHAAGAVGCLVLAILTLSAGWRLAFSPQSTGGPELWQPVSASSDLQLLERTLEEVSMAERGQETGLAIRAQVQPPAALAWVLRRYTDATASPGSQDTLPQVILLPASDIQPSLPGSYVGQTFSVETVWGWDGPLPPDPLGWWIVRQGASQPINWVLYVHSDAPQQP
jgi:hypothetical protein